MAASLPVCHALVIYTRRGRMRICRRSLFPAGTSPNKNRFASLRFRCTDTARVYTSSDPPCSVTR